MKQKFNLEAIIEIITLLIILGISCLFGFYTSQSGFWNGLFDGGLMPFKFLWSLFKDGIFLYRGTNVWYDLGYVIGSMTIFGTITFALKDCN